jgi:hypothetical protein
MNIYYIIDILQHLLTKEFIALVLVPKRIRTWRHLWVMSFIFESPFFPKIPRLSRIQSIRIVLRETSSGVAEVFHFNRFVRPLLQSNLTDAIQYFVTATQFCNPFRMIFSMNKYTRSEAWLSSNGVNCDYVSIQTTC